MAQPALKIEILGGGPSGLYLAMLVKKRQPQHQITVYEQNRAEDTFGFGVVLADTGMAKFEAADAGSAQALRAVMTFANAQTIRLNNQSMDIKRPGTGGGAIARISLLRILQAQAQAAGVDVRFSTRVDVQGPDMASAIAQADIVVGADGGGSLLRSRMNAEFGTTHYLLGNRFAWYGTRKVFSNPALVFRQFEVNGKTGHFVAHYYPYSSSMSTFVAECDAATWVDCGLDQMADAQRQALFEQIYAPELEGHTLVSSNSVWRQFAVVRNRHWSHGKYVLMGDALATAHFSIGSGTRIAMEDAVALADAICAGASVPQMLQQYEQTRRPGKDTLIHASEASFNWYEAMAQKMACGNVHEFVYDFMTRTGRVDAERLVQQFPELVAALEKHNLKVAA
jgi:2-polyprenyl-6-methoxyphenol hydroxylase-like FAD-dependent oxidoreductase